MRQRRTGLGWRGLGELPDPASEATLEVADVDAAFERIASLAGPGSQAARAAAVEALFGLATPAEQRWLRGAVTGEVRQGALDALVQEAVAVAAGVPLRVVRRAAMLAGSTRAVVTAAFAGGADALGRDRPRGRAPGAADARLLGEDAAPRRWSAPAAGPSRSTPSSTAIRIQVHRDGDEVRIATRTLEDITARLPEVVEVVRALPGRRFVLDGEAIALDATGRPRPFQETASRTAQRAVSEIAVTPYFFDLLHLDEEDLLDSPGAERPRRTGGARPRVVAGAAPGDRRCRRGRGVRRDRRSPAVTRAWW